MVEKRSGRGSNSFWDFAGPVAMIGVGIAMVVLAQAYQPTFENAVMNEGVLSDTAYNVLLIAGCFAIVVGAVGVVYQTVKAARRD